MYVLARLVPPTLTLPLKGGGDKAGQADNGHCLPRGETYLHAFKNVTKSASSCGVSC
jgi:hypothetical protein